MWPVLAMAGGSMLYNEFVQKPRQQRMNEAQGEAAAAQTQFSPWTKMGAGKANIQQAPSTIGAGMQGAMTGLSMQQQFDQAATSKKLADQQVQMNNMKMNSMQPQYTTSPQAGGYDSFNPWAQRQNAGTMVG